MQIIWAKANFSYLKEKSVSQISLPARENVEIMLSGCFKKKLQHAFKVPFLALQLELTAQKRAREAYSSRETERCTVRECALWSS